MQVISFMNMKGGVGKTTLAVNVAYGLAYFYSKKVLLIDVDPQFNATQCLIEDDEYLELLNDPKRGTVYDIFQPKRSGPISTVRNASRVVGRVKGEAKTCVHTIWAPRHSTGRLDLVPSTLALIEVENLARQAEKRLMNFIKQKAQGYDYVIIDCPPTISIFTQAAILASQKYLVPIKPDPLSVIGLPLLERWLDDYAEDSGISLASVGIVFTMVRGPTPTRMKEVMNELRENRPDEVFPYQLSQADAVARSVEEHKPIFLTARTSKTAGQMKRIIGEFVKRTESADD